MHIYIKKNIHLYQTVVAPNTSIQLHTFGTDDRVWNLNTFIIYWPNILYISTSVMEPRNKAGRRGQFRSSRGRRWLPFLQFGHIHRARHHAPFPPSFIALQMAGILIETGLCLTFVNLVRKLYYLAFVVNDWLILSDLY